MLSKSICDGNLYCAGTWSSYFESNGVLNARNFPPIKDNDFLGQLNHRGGMGPGFLLCPFIVFFKLIEIETFTKNTSNTSQLIFLSLTITF